MARAPTYLCILSWMNKKGCTERRLAPQFKILFGGLLFESKHFVVASSSGLSTTNKRPKRQRLYPSTFGVVAFKVDQHWHLNPYLSTDRLTNNDSTE